MPRNILDDLSQLIHSVYRAAEKPEVWHTVLNDLLTLTGAQNAGLVLHDLSNSTALVIPIGYDPAEIDRYLQYYSSVNPWLPRDDTPPTDGPIVRSEEIVPVVALRKTEFYADWGKKNDVVHSMIANLKIGDGKFLYLHIGRGERKGQHTKEAEQLLGLLLPHFQRALRHHEEFERAALLSRTLSDLSQAIFIINVERRVLEMTRHAERLLKSQKYFCLKGRRQLRGVTRDLERGIERSIRLLSAAGGPRNTAMLLSAVDDHLAPVLTVVREEVGGLGFEPAAHRFVLTVIEQNAATTESLNVVAPLFNLTKAEMRLIAELLSTGSLDRAIGKLGITRNTARTQMASVYSKTKTSRQGQIIRLFSQIERFTQMGDEI